MKRILFLFSIISVNFCAFSQDNQDSSLAKSLKIQESTIAVTSNKQKTANSQDLLTNLYKASLDSILGKKHSFTFNSTFAGIDSLFVSLGKSNKRNKSNDAINNVKDLKTYLKKQKFLDHNSLNLSLKGDSNNNLTDASLGFSITLINKRDIKYTVIKYIDMLQSLDKALNNYQNILKLISIDLLKRKGDLVAKEFRDDMDNAKKNNDFSKLSNANKNILKEYINHNEFTKEEKKSMNSMLDDQNTDYSHKIFEDIKTIYSRKPLLTFSPALTYNITNKQPTYSFGLDFLVGLNSTESDHTKLSHTTWELEAKLIYMILNDTSIKKTNYNNKPLAGSLGINKVLLQDANNQSTMEFKFFGEYDYQFGTIPTGVDAYKLTLNSTFRVKVYKSLWLPITVKYDPKNGNVFGFISITANLGS